jgi:hypothetical protein
LRRLAANRITTLRVPQCLPGCNPGSAQDEVRRLLDLPPVAGFCTHGSPAVHLRGLRRPDSRAVMRFSCKSWACRVCSARKLEEAGVHFGIKLLLAEGVLFEKATDPEEWRSHKRRLQRLGASWVRVGSVGQAGVILGCHPAPMGRALSDRALAVKRLGEALRALRPLWSKVRSRPIGSSRDWKLPRRARNYESLGWIRLSSPEELTALLRTQGIEATVRHNQGGRIWDVLFSVPPGWDMSNLVAFKPH